AELRRVQLAEPGQVAVGAIPKVVVIAPGRTLLDPVDDRPHAVDPVDAAITRVPDQADPAARAEDSCELGYGAVVIEPMEGLCDRLDAQVLDVPRDRVGRIRRPRRLVVGRVREPGRRNCMDHAPSLAPTSKTAGTNSQRSSVRLAW